jgi:hypothetical protein
MEFKSYFTTAEELQTQLGLSYDESICIMIQLSIHKLVPLPKSISFNSFLGFSDTYIMEFCEGNYFLISNDCDDNELDSYQL